MPNEKQAKMNAVLVLALLVAIIPAAWAVLTIWAAGQFNIAGFGPVALISAAICYADAGRTKPALNAGGFVLGTIWGMLSVLMIFNLPFGMLPNVFVTLAIMAGSAVLLGMTVLEKVVSLNTYLGALAISVLCLLFAGANPGMPVAALSALSLNLIVNMLAGVYVIGVLLLKIHGSIVGALNK